MMIANGFGMTVLEFLDDDLFLYKISMLNN